MASHKLVDKVSVGERGDGVLKKYSDSPYWYSCLSVNGREHRASTGETDLKRAKRFHRKKLREKGADKLGLQKFVTPRAQRTTVEALLDAYLKSLKLGGARSYDRFVSAAKPVRKALGHLRAADITTARLDQYIEARLDDDKENSTVNRETGLLVCAFEHARETKLLTVETPSVRKLEENVRQGFFEDDEIARVIEHLPSYLTPLVRFAALTGWRKGECVALLWEHVNLRTNTITLPGALSKNGKARSIALGGDLLPLIQTQERGRLVTRRDGTPVVASHVFHRQGATVGDFKNAWRAALTKAGFSHVEKNPRTGKLRTVYDKLFHDLRRTAVRNMVDKGVDPVTAMSISGHKTRSMFDRYSIRTGENQRKAFEALAAR